MYTTHDLESAPVYEALVRALELGRAAPEHCDVVTGTRAPQIVQLAGDDAEALARTAKRLAPYADGIDLNLGCPQRRARDGHYGGYLLGRREWPLLDTIGTSHALIQSRRSHRRRPCPSRSRSGCVTTRRTRRRSPCASRARARRS